MLKSLIGAKKEEGSFGGSSLIGHLLADENDENDENDGQGRPGSRETAGGAGERKDGQGSSDAEFPGSQAERARRKGKPKPPPTRNAATKKEVPPPSRKEAARVRSAQNYPAIASHTPDLCVSSTASHSCASLQLVDCVDCGGVVQCLVSHIFVHFDCHPFQVMDVHGSVMFLRGKLKEMVDLLGGPEEVQRKQNNDQDIRGMTKFLSELLRGEDDTAKRIEHGLSLQEASRHRPDILLGDAMQSLKRFDDVRLAALRMFGTEGMAILVKEWTTVAVESFLSIAILALLRCSPTMPCVPACCWPAERSEASIRSHDAAHCTRHELLPNTPFP